jgi:hypothetical protein
VNEQPKVLNVLGVMNDSDINGKYVRAEDYDKIKAERDALKADAERYRYLRIHCYRYRWPNNEHDRAMQLSFTVSGIWANNHDPEVLDGCIDTAREVKP